MKKTITRIVLVFMTLTMGLSTTVMAQYHGRSHSSHYRSDNFGRTLRDVETVANVAMIGSAVSSTTDYTGIRFGYNAASLRTTGMSNLDHDINSGFNCGIVFGWYLGHTPFIIEPGLYYSMKGGSLSGYDSYNDDKTKLKTTMHTFEIPLVFKYEVQFHNAGVCLHPFFGGFLSFGCGGKSKESCDGYHDSWDTYGSGEGQYSRTDAGFRMGCGLGIDHLFLELAYDLGCVNLANRDFDYFDYDDFDSTVRTNTLSLNIGFNF